MAHITPGNHLYLYQLLSRELGTGRQIMLARVEEVLLADDILPSDLGCTNTRELLEHLGDWVRLTVFKKGRVYATVITQPQWDELLEQAQREEPAKQTGGKDTKRSWKRKRAKKDPRPTKPRPHGRVKPAAEEDTTAAETPASQEAQVVPEEPVAAEGQTATEAKAATQEPASQEARAAAEGRTPEASAAAEGPTTEGAVANEVTTAEEETVTGEAKVPQAAETLASAPAKVEAGTAIESEAPSDTIALFDQTAESQPSITFTITYDPDADETQPTSPPADADDATTPTNSAPSDDDPPEPQHEQPLAPPEPESPTQHLPQDFMRDVHCGNEPLAALYAMLSLDTDPFVLLDEDWRVARSTQSFSWHSGTLVFPLRLVSPSNGAPIRVFMRRCAPTASGRRWTVVDVEPREEVGMEGLPVMDNETLRSFAQAVELGPWDALVERLAALQTPFAALTESELRTYLPATFSRIRHERKFVIFDRGAQAAFDTGLLAHDGTAIIMLLAANPTDIDWRFVDFALDGDPRLQGLALAPPCFVRSLCDVVVTEDEDVAMDDALKRTRSARMEHAVAVALRRLRRDWRLGTPAYDPLADEVHLLAPLCLEDDGCVDHALVLKRTEDGRRMVTAVLPLERAAACARIVSRDLPHWLER